MITKMTYETKIELPPFSYARLIFDLSEITNSKVSLRLTHDEVRIPDSVVSYVCQGGSFKSYIKDTGSILTLLNKVQCDILTEAIIIGRSKISKAIAELKE